MDKKRILVDIDDTLINNKWHLAINSFLGTNYKREEIKHYSIDKYVTDNNERLRFFKTFSGDNFYDGCTVIKDAKRVLKKLNEVYDVYICSACVMNIGKGLAYANAYNAKFQILQKHFPFISPEKFIFTNNKNIISADVIIDDSLFNLHGNVPTKIMFGGFMNEDVSDSELKKLNITKVYSWKEIEKILLK